MSRLVLVGSGVCHQGLRLLDGRLVAVVRKAADLELVVALAKRPAPHGLGEVNARKGGLGVVGVGERDAILVDAVALGRCGGVVVGDADDGELAGVVALGVKVAHHVGDLGGVPVVPQARALAGGKLLAHGKRVGAGPLERDARLAEVDILGLGITLHALGLALGGGGKDHGAVPHGLLRRGICRGVDEGEGLAAGLPTTAREGLDALDGAGRHLLGVIAVGEGRHDALGERHDAAVRLHLVVQILGADAVAFAVVAHDDVILGAIVVVAGLAGVHFGEAVNIGLARVLCRREVDARELHVARGVVCGGEDAVRRALGHGRADGLVDGLGVKGGGVAAVAADGLEAEAEHTLRQGVGARVVRIGLVGHEGHRGLVVVVGVGEGGGLIGNGGVGGGHACARVVGLLGHEDVRDLERAVMLILDGHLDLIARSREGHAVLLAGELEDGVGVGARSGVGDVAERDVGVLVRLADSHVNIGGTGLVRLCVLGHGGAVGRLEAQREGVAVSPVAAGEGLLGPEALACRQRGGRDAVAVDEDELVGIRRLVAGRGGDEALDGVALALNLLAGLDAANEREAVGERGALAGLGKEGAQGGKEVPLGGLGLGGDLLHLVVVTGREAKDADGLARGDAVHVAIPELERGASNAAVGVEDAGVVAGVALGQLEAEGERSVRGSKAVICRDLLGDLQARHAHIGVLDAGRLGEELVDLQIAKVIAVGGLGAVLDEPHAVDARVRVDDGQAAGVVVGDVLQDGLAVHERAAVLHVHPAIGHRRVGRDALGGGDLAAPRKVAVAVHGGGLERALDVDERIVQARLAAEL